MTRAPPFTASVRYCCPWKTDRGFARSRCNKLKAPSADGARAGRRPSSMAAGETGSFAPVPRSIPPAQAGVPVEDFFKFTFIRNPWDLIISKYLAPFYSSINFLSGKDLSYFLENYYPAPNEAGDSFFDYFDPDEMNFIGKFESREKDLLHISKSIGINKKAQSFLSLFP